MLNHTCVRAAHHHIGMAAMIAVAGLGGTAHAEVRTLRFDMPVNIGVFGLVWQADYFEPAFEGTIADARLVVNFNTDTGARPFHDAADILFQHQLPTTTLPFWNVRGSELGWSGTGAFSASLSTSAFNGQPLIDEGDLVLWFGRIVSDNDAEPVLGGRLTNSYWEFDVNVVPAPGAGAAVMGAFIGLAARRRRR